MGQRLVSTGVKADEHSSGPGFDSLLLHHMERYRSGHNGADSFCTYFMAISRSETKLCDDEVRSGIASLLAKICNEIT